MPDSVTWAEAFDRVGTGRTLYVPGSTGEPAGLCDWLAANPEAAKGATFVGGYVPGINAFDYGALGETVGVVSPFANPALKAATAGGRLRQMPLTYAASRRFIDDGAGIDVAFLHLSMADAGGRCSFGLAAEFSPTAARAAKRRIGILNPLMPAMPGAMPVALDDLDMVIEAEMPLRATAVTASPATLTRIAGRVSGLIPDRATIQIGIGSLGLELCRNLSSHRGIRVHSGVMGDGLMLLDEVGALDADAAIVAGVLYGSEALYDYGARRGGILIEGVEDTHDLGRFPGIERFVAVNAALEVDLFGQVNAELVGGRFVSGAGGSPDFARAARLSPGGLAMVALASTASGGTVSRIVPRLEGPVSLARHEIDMVVTEHGAAPIGRLDVEARSQALIAIADPAWQPRLAEAWRELSACRTGPAR